MSIKLSINRISIENYRLLSLEGLEFVTRTGIISNLYGANGTGKTTILKLISGKNNEKISFDGNLLVHHDIRLLDTSGLSLFPFRNLYTSIFSEISAREKNFRVAVDKAISTLKQFKLPENYLVRDIYSISTGERKILGLIFLYVISPRVVLIDEPLTHIDDVRRKQVWDIIFKICNEGSHVLITSHTHFTFREIHNIEIKNINNSLFIKDLDEIIINSINSRNNEGFLIETTNGLRFSNNRGLIGKPAFIKMINYSLSIKSTIFHIKGMNGTGKTSLIRTLGGLRIPYDGMVSADKRPLYLKRRKSYRKDFISKTNYILRSYIDFEDEICRATEVLTKFTQLKSLLDVLFKRSKWESKPLTLSSGQISVILLLSAIICNNNSTLILDEPFSSLDNKWFDTMSHILDSFVKISNSTCIIADHMMYSNNFNYKDIDLDHI